MYSSSSLIHIIPIILLMFRAQLLPVTHSFVLRGKPYQSSN